MIPNPVNRTCPSTQFTRILAGLMSLWIRSRRWTPLRAELMPVAMRRNPSTSIGSLRSSSSGSPPGSSSTSSVTEFFRH